MIISLIVAASENNVIGVDGDLPWHLTADLRRFKAITMGKPMIMGRATYDSIGRALPGRRSIVLSRRPDLLSEGCEVVATVQDALVVAGEVEEVMVIGGGAIYALFLPLADRIYFTRVHTEIAGDTFFPELDRDKWLVVAAEEFPSTDTQEYAFTLQVLERNSDAIGTAIPIDCSLHDYLEVACLYRYDLEVHKKDGSTSVGKVTNTRTAEKIEYLLVTIDGELVEISMSDIARVVVLTENARFREIDFSRAVTDA